MSESLQFQSNFYHNLSSRLNSAHINDKKVMQSETQDRVSKLLDNFAWRSATQMGRNKTARYYYLNEPSERELWKTARYTAIGNRVTQGRAEDDWNNDFKIKIEGIEENEMIEKNALMQRHLREIKFYSEAMKATFYDYEQGESLLVSFRKNTYNNYNSFSQPANLNDEIIRVMAVNKMDYNIDKIKEFGNAVKYKINFYKEGAGKPCYVIDPSHAVRWKTNDIDYDIYTPQSKLKAIFGELTILAMITRACGDAAYRWGLGIPTFFTKDLKSQSDIDKVKNIIGNPTTQSWMMIPQEFVDRVEMLGVSGSMLNLKELADIVINLIVSATEIPRPILMGEVAGVQTGSEVNERSYFAVLDKDHTKLESMIREFFTTDPFMRDLIGDKDYSIDWGLRQVMSERDKAELDEIKIRNAVALMPLAFYDECRVKAGLKPVFEAVKDPIFFEEVYGMTPEQMGGLFANHVAQIVGFGGNNQTDESEEETDNEEEQDNDQDQDETEKLKQDIKESGSKLSQMIVSYRDLTSLNKSAELLGVSKGSVPNWIDKLNHFATI